MKDFLSKTLGGLSKEYYFRQLFFGLIFFGLMTWLILQSANTTKFSIIFVFALFTLLYPYSRFVYESIVEFIMGNNTFFASGVLLLIAIWFKVMMMAMCWIFSIFIAPIGMLYLYFYHTKSNNSAHENS